MMIFWVCGESWWYSYTLLDMHDSLRVLQQCVFFLLIFHLDLFPHPCSSTNTIFLCLTLPFRPWADRVGP